MSQSSDRTGHPVPPVDPVDAEGIKAEGMGAEGMGKGGRDKAVSSLRLGVNIDHVATIRNARGGAHPDPVRAAEIAAMAGADGITAHLREDRRHISDRDIQALCRDLALPLNLEMAPTPEMLAIALAHRPHAVCLVPEKRKELTTEGGLDLSGTLEVLERLIGPMAAAGIRVSLFIDPDPEAIRAAAGLGVPVVELHTGQFCDAAPAERPARYQALVEAAALADSLGLECHAGHGLDYDTAARVAEIPQIRELNIGHFLIGEAIFCGLDAAIRRMRKAIDTARNRGESR